MNRRIQYVPSKFSNAKDAIQSIHNEGGIAVCAHPFSTHHFTFGDQVFDFAFDAIEINGGLGKKENKQAKMAAEIMNLPTIGGSDAHNVLQLNRYGTKFSKNINSVEDIVESIKKGNCEAVRI